MNLIKKTQNMRVAIKSILQKFFKSKLSYVVLWILVLNVIAALGHIFFKFYFNNEYGIKDYAKLFLSAALLLLYFYTFIKKKE